MDTDSVRSRLARLFMSPAAYLVWRALGVPLEWESWSPHCIRHKPTDITLEFSFPGYDVYQDPMFGPIDRLLLWRRGRRINRLAHNKLTKREKRQRLFLRMMHLSDEGAAEGRDAE